MHVTIRYTGTRRERLARGYADAMEWNSKAVHLIEGEFRRQWIAALGLTQRKQAINCAHLYASLVGIQGLPVRAILHHALSCPPWQVLSSDGTARKGAA